MAAKISVTVTPELQARVVALVSDVQGTVTPIARKAVDRSSICQVAIADLVDRYEACPGDLAARLGLAAQQAGGA